MSNRGSFFASEEWLEQPWTEVPKSPHDEVLDLLFRIGAIMQQADKLDEEKDLDVVEEGTHDLIAESMKIVSALDGLYAKCEQASSGPLYWAELSTLESSLDNETQGKVFPVSFCFSAFVIGQVVTTYWSGLMTIHLSLMHSYQRLASIEMRRRGSEIAYQYIHPPAGQSSNITVLSGPLETKAREHHATWTAMAKNICQAAEYMIQSKMGWLGPISMLTLLEGSKVCFGDEAEKWSKEIGWIEEMMDIIRQKFTFPVDEILKLY